LQWRDRQRPHYTSNASLYYRVENRRDHKLSVANKIQSLKPAAEKYSYRIFGRIGVLHTYMRSIVTGQVQRGQSVGLSQ